MHLYFSLSYAVTNSCYVLWHEVEYAIDIEIKAKYNINVEDVVHKCRNANCLVP